MLDIGLAPNGDAQRLTARAMPLARIIWLSHKGFVHGARRDLRLEGNDYIRWLLPAKQTNIVMRCLERTDPGTPHSFIIAESHDEIRRSGCSLGFIGSFNFSGGWAERQRC